MVLCGLPQAEDNKIVNLNLTSLLNETDRDSHTASGGFVGCKW